MEEVSMDPKEFAKELGPAADQPIGPFVGLASIALNLAMKYHDISTVHDGALYQQYKLEGRNLQPLHIDIVFETAMQIEKHLIASHKRIADALLVSLIDETGEDGSAPLGEAPSSSAPGAELTISNESGSDAVSLKQNFSAQPNLGKE